MSHPASTGVPSAGRPAGASRRKRSRWAPESRWGTTETPPGFDFSGWLPWDSENAYLPCHYYPHPKKVVARADGKGFALPKEGPDPRCEERRKLAGLRADRMLGAVQVWMMTWCGEVGGAFRPVEEHDCLRQGVVLEWADGTGRKFRDRVTKRIERRIERHGPGSWAYIIPSLESLAHENLVQRTYSLSVVLRPASSHPHRSSPGKHPISWKEARRLLSRLIINNYVLNGSGLQLQEDRPQHRIRAVGFQTLSGETSEQPKGVGAANPRARLCPHPDHVLEIPKEYDSPRPVRIDYQPKPLENGLQPTFLYGRDQRCSVHGLPTVSPYDNLDWVSKDRSAKSILEEAGYKIEKGRMGDLETYDLVRQAEDIAEMREMADRFEEYAGELAEDLPNLEEMDDGRAKDDPGQRTWQDWEKLMLLYRQVTHLRHQAGLLREQADEAEWKLARREMAR